MPKEFEVEIRLRNNLLKQKRIEAGYPTAKALAQAAGVSYTAYIDLENLHDRPTRISGAWREVVIKVCTHLGLDPAEIFPPAVRRVAESGTAKVVKAIGAEDLARLVAPGATRLALPASDLYDEAELSQVASRALATLTPREERVLRARFGIGADGESYTLDGVAKTLGVHKERVRQIEANALRKLRHPSRSRQLTAFFDPESS